MLLISVNDLASARTLCCSKQIVIYCSPKSTFDCGNSWTGMIHQVAWLGDYSCADLPQRHSIRQEMTGLLLDSAGDRDRQHVLMPHHLICRELHRAGGGANADEQDVPSAGPWLPSSGTTLRHQCCCQGLFSSKCWPGSPQKALNLATLEAHIPVDR